MSDDTIRLDKWLWQARFFKTRTLAATVIAAGKVRVDGNIAPKPARLVGPDRILTFAQGDTNRVVRILACGTRRGPATEAQVLFADLTPLPTQDKFPANPGFDGKGRPGKRERRNMATYRVAGGPFDLE